MILSVRVSLIFRLVRLWFIWFNFRINLWMLRIVRLWFKWMWSWCWINRFRFRCWSRSWINWLWLWGWIIRFWSWIIRFWGRFNRLWLFVRFLWIYWFHWVWHRVNNRFWWCRLITLLFFLFPFFFHFFLFFSINPPFNVNFVSWKSKSTCGETKSTLVDIKNCIESFEECVTDLDNFWSSILIVCNQKSAILLTLYCNVIH